MPTLAENLKAFQALKTDLYQKDFLLTWQHPEEELRAIVTLADTLKGLHKAGKSFKAFDTGLAISIFRDNSTRTRFSFASAANASRSVAVLPARIATRCARWVADAALR